MWGKQQNAFEAALPLRQICFGWFFLLLFCCFVVGVGVGLVWFELFWVCLVFCGRLIPLNVLSMINKMY